MINLYNILVFSLFLLGMPVIAACVLLDVLKIRERLGIKSPPLNENSPVWIHAASVGESTIALALAARMRQLWPGISVSISTQTVTGLVHLRERCGQSDVFIAPVDISFVVDTFLHRIRPSCLLVIETEIWPNLIAGAYRMGIPVGIINGRISRRSMWKYYRFRWLFKEVLQHIRLFCVQSDADRKRFILLGADPHRIHVLGNMKFDISDAVNRQKPIHQSKNIHLPENRPVVVLGSIRAEEEPIVLEAVTIVMAARPDTLFVWVPRYSQRAAVMARYLQERGISHSFRSQEANPGNISVYLVDTMGELHDFYRFADVAFVGGSLAPLGGHNPLEPASHGKPILFGPYMEQEGCRELIQSGGAQVVRDAGEFASAVEELLDSQEKRQSMGESARKTHRDRTGVLDRTIDYLIKEGMVGV